MTARRFFAPGRVNLIGEHTDYNDGFVLPAALHFGTTATLSANSHGLELISESASPGWTNYVTGVAEELKQLGIQVPPAKLDFSSDVPIGAGLSSSAALEVSSALALLAAAGRTLSKRAIAQACQQAEINAVGTRCGIMDQFISLHGQAGAAIQLDCRSLDHRAVPIPEGVAIVVANTMVKHELAGSEYNLRRADCEEAARRMGLASLRDATTAPERSDTVSRRAHHVITENARVLAFVEALERGDLKHAGRLMEESHASLRDDYEVSCHGLDLMADAAQCLPGYIGARMTGGGFGGCTVNLVHAENAAAFAEALRAAYKQSTGIEAEIYITRASEGARELA
jgi:galactokinase